MSPEPGRLRESLRLELGVEELGVEPDGPGREIAVVRVGAETLPRLMRPEVRERIVALAREAGFRYAAVDLAVEAPGA